MYCGLNSKPTKEHIWPSTLIKKNEMTHTYNPRDNSFFRGDPVIKDVCTTCNNIQLSQLDSYLSSLFNLYFKKILKPGESVTVSYSYDLLLRSLLKISYNASRASGNEKNTMAHTKFSQYILNGGYCPQIMLRLQIVTASRRVNLESNDESEFTPKLLRCGQITYDGSMAHRFLIKLIAINCYWFYLIIPFKIEKEHKWRELLEGFSNWRIQSGVLVDPKSSILNIPVEKTTYFHPDLLGTLKYANFASPLR